MKNELTKLWFLYFAILIFILAIPLAINQKYLELAAATLSITVFIHLFIKASTKKKR
jgi:hypothetical protein